MADRTHLSSVEIRQEVQFCRYAGTTDRCLFRLRPFLRGTICLRARHVQNLSDRARRARELLRDWDGRLTMDSVAATIEGNSRRELIRLLLEPKLGTLNWRN